LATRPQRSSLTLLKLEEIFWGTFAERPIWNTQFKNEVGCSFCVGLSGIIMAFSWYRARITAKEYLDDYAMNQTLFPNNKAAIHDDNADIQTARTLQSWFEEHEDELRHILYSVHSPRLNIF
jgi:hypothetical protein